MDDAMTDQIAACARETALMRTLWETEQQIDSRESVMNASAIGVILSFIILSFIHRWQMLTQGAAFLLGLTLVEFIIQGIKVRPFYTRRAITVYDLCEMDFDKYGWMILKLAKGRNDVRLLKEDD